MTSACSICAGALDDGHAVFALGWFGTVRTCSLCTSGLRQRLGDLRNMGVMELRKALEKSPGTFAAMQAAYQTYRAARAITDREST